MRERIKAIRKSLHLTQAEFSIALGLAPTSAANWEKKAAQEPTESIKKLICKTFNVNPTYLEAGEGEMFSENRSLEAVLDASGITDSQKDLIREVLALPADMQSAFLQIMRGLNIDNVPQPVKFKSVPMIGEAILDGSIEARAAAKRELAEMETETTEETT